MVRKTWTQRQKEGWSTEETKSTHRYTKRDEDLSIKYKKRGKERE